MSPLLFTTPLDVVYFRMHSEIKKHFGKKPLQFQQSRNFQALSRTLHRVDEIRTHKDNSPSNHTRQTCLRQYPRQPIIYSVGVKPKMICFSRNIICMRITYDTVVRGICGTMWMMFNTECDNPENKNYKNMEKKHTFCTYCDK